MRKLKPPKPPAGTAMWQNSGYFYIKPKSSSNGKPVKTFYFMCDIRERDKWIYSIREVSASFSSPVIRSTISASGITLDGFNVAGSASCTPDSCWRMSTVLTFPLTSTSLEGQLRCRPITNRWHRGNRIACHRCPKRFRTPKHFAYVDFTEQN